jgi:hypothetical protein
MQKDTMLLYFSRLYRPELFFRSFPSSLCRYHNPTVGVAAEKKNEELPSY